MTTTALLKIYRSLQKILKKPSLICDVYLVTIYMRHSSQLTESTILRKRPNSSYKWHIKSCRFPPRCHISAVDLSSAPDTLDHEILINRLRDDYGFKGIVLEWFTSILTDRSVWCSWRSRVPSSKLHYDVPKASFLDLYCSLSLHD